MWIDKQRCEIRTVHRVRWFCGACKRKEGWVEVDTADDFMADGPRGDLAGPAEDVGHPQSTVELAALLATQWQVAGVVGAPAVFRVAQSAVIGCEHDERVLSDPELIERTDDSPHAIIQAFDHRSGDRTSLVLARLLFLKMLEVRRLGFKRSVNEEIGEVKEERLLFGIAVLDELNSLVGKEITQILVGIMLNRRIGMETEMGTGAFDSDIKAAFEGC